MDRDNLVETTRSDWAAPSLLIPKDGTYRLVVDYRVLKKQIEKTRWPFPRINEVIVSLEANMVFSNKDLLSRYFPIALDEDRKNLTAFITPPGLYKWKKLPTGLSSVLGAFENTVEIIFACFSYEMGDLQTLALKAYPRESNEIREHLIQRHCIKSIESFQVQLDLRKNLGDVDMILDKPLERALHIEVVTRIEAEDNEPRVYAMHS